MALSLTEQFDVATSSWMPGDFDTLSKVLTSPDSITIDEQRTIAEKMGFKGGFLSAITDIVADPTIWAAFLLSRRFPTSQYIKGVIPQRFIGTANEFTGLSSVTRTVEGFFRGTNVSKLIGLKMRREAEVLQVGNRIFDKLITRPAWKEEMPIVSQLLEGQHPAGATPELRGLAGDIRNHMTELWDFLSKTQKVSGGFDSERGIRRAIAGPFPAGRAPRFLRDYLPHIPITGPESIITISGRESLERMMKGRTGQALQVQRENPFQVWTPTDADRLTSTWEDYQRFMNRVGSQVFTGRLFSRKRLGITLQSAEGQGLFITDLNAVLQKYIHSVARTYALNAPLSTRERSFARTFIEDATGKVRAIHPTSEPIIVQVINEGLDSVGGTRIIQRPVAGTNVVEQFVDSRTANAPGLGALRTLVRELKGQADDNEALVGNLINSVRFKVSQSMRSVTGRKEMARIEDGLSTIQRDAQGREMNRKITSFFYATTLGVNPSSALKNMFQPFLTTAPSIGMGPTLKGLGVLKERMPRYAREFITQRRALAGNRAIPGLARINLAQERAFSKVFPEMVESGIKADPRAFEVSPASLIEDQISGRIRFKNDEAFFKFLLQPFTQTEIGNQVTTFFGGKEAIRQAIRRGEMDVPVQIGTNRALTGSELDGFLDLEAASLVNSTQFRPGAGSRTVLQTLIPAPFRQFTSFPIRLLNHFGESTVRGAMTQAQLNEASALTKLTGGRNLGTLARTVMLGKAVTTGLRDTLGVDMADAMGVTGPFTGIVESGRIFSPLTFSPAPSILMGLASFTSSRDVRDLNPMTLPVFGEVPFPKTLVPGGVAISRMVKGFRAYRPDLGGFVDEDERLMFEGDTADAIMGMLGIPLEKERRMREAMDRVRANRFRVRKLRRRYAVAARNFDTGEMDRTERVFAEEFPEIGSLGVSPRDLQRYDEQARITALQRMLPSLGKRFKFLEKNLYEFDPDLVVTGEEP